MQEGLQLPPLLAELLQVPTPQELDLEVESKEICHTSALCFLFQCARNESERGVQSLDLFLFFFRKGKKEHILLNAIA
jgi:hypothetical protein